ncbi:PAS domain S-box protein [Daejeonella lutea]|uniref:histidine kinase n=1 Tax=Daejeonella lutea TaxID=572036 RepID=A0A1T5B2C5_9SPHI|nr:PAS domain S-box protein [Daejeonella lutea]SKB41398.1 PAS domain S-box-containing protein [Daejeonella lutea]
MTEATYKQLFYNSPVPMYVFDAETFDFYSVNEAALQQYGYTQAEFLQLKATDIRPQEEVASFYHATKGAPERYIDFGRWRHLKKTGEIFNVQVYAHTTEFEGKKVRVVLAINIEDTVRTESDIANILESITDGFYALNRNWEVTYFNKTAERVLGCTRKEIIGKNLWEFFPESKNGRFYTEYSRAMNEGISVHFEECYAPLGVWGSMHVYPTRDGIAVYFVDITEQKKIQEKILRDEENLRAIINNTSDLIWSIGLDYEFISANNAFWERLEQKTGRKVSQLIEGDFERETMEEFSEYYNRCFAGEAFKIIREDKMEGRIIFEEISFNPILDKNRQVVGVSTFARDITKQHLYTQMIEKQNEQLRKIAWIQSHELRAPVANILGLLPLFDRTNLTNPDDLEFFSLMEKAATKMDEIVKKITDETITVEDYWKDSNVKGYW